MRRRGYTGQGLQMWGRLTTCAAVDYRRSPAANAAGRRWTIGSSLPSCPTRSQSAYVFSLGPSMTPVTRSRRIDIIANPSVVRVGGGPVSYTHLRAHETRHDLVCRL